MKKKIGLTIGEPTGIGPEIILKAIEKLSEKNIIVIYGNFPPTSKTNSLIEISKISEINKFPDRNKFWIQIHPEEKFEFGNPSKMSGIAAFETIKIAGKDALNGELNAIVTGPISKSHIQLTYPDFIGHTEFFAKQANSKNFVMSFFSKKINIALLTTHLALNEVSKNLSIDKIENQIKLIHKALRKYLKFSCPKLALLAVNPHCGENGAFGNEEQKILIPVIKNLAKEGIFIEGPFSADTFFTKKYQKYDMIISPYHDQGLIPFKMLSFGSGVNVTFGLPYIRTSVDHGTAFDIAGKNIASEKSLLAAFKLADKMMR